MAEVEDLCDRIAILHEGEISFVGTVEDLSLKVGKQYNISIRTDKGIEKMESGDINETLSILLDRYREEGTGILDIQIDRGSLEQHFIKITKENKK